MKRLPIVCFAGTAALIGTWGAAIAKTAPVPAEARTVATTATAHPAIWPAYHYPVPKDAATEARIAALVKRMTIEEKIGQLIQGDICCTTPADAKTYHLGSILAGGSSGPNGDDKAPAAKWLELADQFYAASVDKSGGATGVPIIWGIDAVHGHANIIGATIFPHNIGLGAARDPALIERIGAATAKEIRVTGQEWTFAPTVTVPQDYRWGRAYEGYSSDPKLVASYVGAMVRGLQGAPGETNLLGRDKVLASTKHFLADGGTFGGADQGDAKISEIELRDIHGVPYGPAIENGVGTVMASFSSWQGHKMTGNKSLLTGVLTDRMGFGGFTVSDWNAHGQVEGCTNDDCPQALLAGIDMYMAPDSWKPLYKSLLREAKAGQVPMARIDEAVTRILRVKARLGLLDAPKPSARALAGQWNLLGAADHRAIAREAVRKSLVLLRNDGVLPLKPGARVLVAGDGADDISRQSGGWTISWQGTGVTNADFPGATSLWAGLKDAVAATGGSAELSPDGSFKTRPDVAVVVFGERPYAEFQGDRKTLALDPELTGPIETMRKLKAQGIKVVALMITGRPLYVSPALNLADAFVVAWLPGSEGAGVADVLVGDRAGKPRFDFTGRLPAVWPQAPTGAGTAYAFGYGLDYKTRPTRWRALTEVSGAAAGDSRIWFASGVPSPSWSLIVADGQGGSQTRITAVPAKALDGRVTVTATDHLVQEGARRFVLGSGAASILLNSFDPLDIAREANGDVMLLFTARTGTAPVKASIAMRGGAGSAAVPVTLPASGDYVRYGLKLKCFAAKGVDMAKVTSPFTMGLDGPADVSIAEVRLGSDAQVELGCGA